jgi:hypothetical protein
LMPGGGWNRGRLGVGTPYAREDLVRDYHELGMSMEEIGAKYGRHATGIGQLFKRWGIKARSRARRNQRGESNPNWGGADVSYFAHHKRVRKIRGTPQLCETCGRTGPGRYEWASKTKNYGDPQDYIRLCKSCHHKFDGLVANLRGKSRCA